MNHFNSKEKTIMREKQDINEYKSPARKLIKFFRKSRDLWKRKYQEVKETVKYLQNRTRFLEKSKEELKNRVKELEGELARLKASEQDRAKEMDEKKKINEIEVLEDNHFFNDKPAYHSYSFDHIALFIMLILSAATSLRSASRVIEIVVSFFRLPVNCPSWFTGRLWLLRIGLYKLTRPKEIGNDWVWIVDHTIQIGPEKCLVILGLRLCELTSCTRSLTHEDVEPIALLPVKKSNGDIVYEQLKEAEEKTGIPREIISDKGSDLTAGIKKYCNDRSGTCSVYDVKHKSAGLLKKELQDDRDWQEFV